MKADTGRVCSTCTVSGFQTNTRASAAAGVHLGQFSWHSGRHMSPGLNRWDARTSARRSGMVLSAASAAATLTRCLAFRERQEEP